MFNPQFSLFQPVPEGGTTFQVQFTRSMGRARVGLRCCGVAQCRASGRGGSPGWCRCASPRWIPADPPPTHPPSLPKPRPWSVQPNPNSVIQNDEARGTNHLDFFKFVGRVVAKVKSGCLLRTCRHRCRRRAALAPAVVAPTDACTAVWGSVPAPACMAHVCGVGPGACLHTCRRSALHTPPLRPCLAGPSLAQALYDGQYVDAHFTRSFYKHVLGQQLTYEDIEAVDPDFYRTLKCVAAAGAACRRRRRCCCPCSSVGAP